MKSHKGARRRIAEKFTNGVRSHGRAEGEGQQAAHALLWSRAAGSRLRVLAVAAVRAVLDAGFHFGSVRSDPRNTQNMRKGIAFASVRVFRGSNLSAGAFTARLLPSPGLWQAGRVGAAVARSIPSRTAHARAAVL